MPPAAKQLSCVCAPQVGVGGKCGQSQPQRKDDEARRGRHFLFGHQAEEHKLLYREERRLVHWFHSRAQFLM